jgi:hypothetical protein
MSEFLLEQEGQAAQRVSSFDQVEAALMSIHPWSRSFVILRHDAGGYVQAAGARLRLSVEYREVQGDSFRHFVLGRRTADTRRSAINCNVGPISIFRHEVLSVTDSIAVFRSFFAERSVPAVYALRECTRLFQDEDLRPEKSARAETSPAPDVTLDKFGRFLMENLRDSCVAFVDGLLAARWKSAPALQAELARFSDRQKALVRRCAIAGIDNAVHDFLFKLQEIADSKNDIQMLVDGRNVVPLSDGIHAEPAGPDGWQARFSRYGENGDEP